MSAHDVVGDAEPGESLRPAAREDAAAVAELEQETFGADAWSPGTVIETLGHAGSTAWVAAGASGLDGYVVVARAGDVLDLQRVAVRPERRRQGLASALLSSALLSAALQGLERVLLEVRADNEAALAFYAARGFVEIDRRRRYYRDGADAVVLQREAT